MSNEIHEGQGYMLMFRNTAWHQGLSPEQMQTVVDNMMAWFKRLKDQGKVTAGQPLETTGKVVSGKNGRVVSDGPFAESKEAIGGYFLLAVDTLDEAVEIAKECPVLAYGAKVEVRQIAATCPHARLAAAEAALTGASA